MVGPVAACGGRRHRRLDEPGEKQARPTAYCMQVLVGTSAGSSRTWVSRPHWRYVHTPYDLRSPVKIAVVGAGAIGAYWGAAMQRGGAEVHLIARNAHLQAMRTNGVRVLSDRGDFVAYPHATDDPREIGPVDYVFLGLKAHGYPSSGPLVNPLLGEHTAVLAAQNGIRS